MSADSMFAKFSLLNVLVSRRIRNIDFHCNGVHVVYGTLYTVYTALLADLLRVEVDPGALARGEAAHYDYAKDLFTFSSADYGSPRDSVLHQQTLLHESVHAMIDLAYAPSRLTDDDGTPNTQVVDGRPMKYVDNEVVAYIAGALFLGWSEEVVSGYESSTPQGTQVFMAAAHVAAKIKDTPGATVTDEDAAYLATFVEADPLYKGHPLYAPLDG